MKAVVLFSGGLDSCLAVALMKEQGLVLEALSFRTPFSPDSETAPAGAAAQVLSAPGIRFRTEELNGELMEIIAHPPHGRGKNMNPCIDCRILMLKRAGQHMQETGASFVVTGEVLGQRPLSQNARAFRLIDRESGLAGLILRPLSARLLPPSIPEIKGWVDRDKLLAIGGRSRKEQLALAKRSGLTELPTPAGGCLLTDSAYSARIRDILEHAGKLTGHLAAVIRFGRFIRMSDRAFLVVGRNAADNSQLAQKQRCSDLSFNPVNCVGPMALGIGEFSEEEILRAAAVVARYSDSPEEGEVAIEMRRGREGVARTVKSAAEGD